jgi:hypothetical protein
MQKKTIVINATQMAMQVRLDDPTNTSTSITTTTTSTPVNYTLTQKSKGPFYTTYNVVPQNSALSTSGSPTVTLYGTAGAEKTAFFNKVPYDTKTLFGLYGCKS